MRGDCSWTLSGLPLLTHPYLTILGTVILSELLMSSFHSGLWLAPLQLPLTVLLTFDLLSFVVILFRKSTSQPLAILMLHETHKIVLGFLVGLKEIQGNWDWVERVGGSLSKSTLCLALSRKHFHFFLADSY